MPNPLSVTLPDYLRSDLRLISIGLNPSNYSVQAGYYFANPRNRFWSALGASSLLPTNQKVDPSVSAVQTLYREYGIGFTDMVKRPTRSSSELRAEDFRVGAEVLMRKFARAHARMLWFHGKVAYRAFLRYGIRSTVEPSWGLQTLTIGNSSVFVTPNPSSANAYFSLDDLIAWYNRLAHHLEREPSKANASAKSH